MSLSVSQLCAQPKTISEDLFCRILFGTCKIYREEITLMLIWCLLAGKSGIIKTLVAALKPHSSQKNYVLEPSALKALVCLVMGNPYNLDALSKEGAMCSIYRLGYHTSNI